MIDLRKEKRGARNRTGFARVFKKRTGQVCVEREK